MAFCSNCGEKLPEDANFCAKCGSRTKTGVETGVSAPPEDWHEAFSRMGVEIDKAFQTAAKEIQKALKNVREDAREPRGRQPVVCKKCGEKNAIDATFCTKCGQKLSS
jgi:ribosomal protein L40E